MTTDALVLRDGVTGEDLGAGLFGADPDAVLRGLLNSLWEVSDREQVYVCSSGGRVEWVLTAEVPAENDHITGRAWVSHPRRGGEVVCYRVTYHLDPGGPEDSRFVRSEVGRVA